MTDLNEYSPVKIMRQLVDEHGMPTLSLSFRFADGYMFNLPILRHTEHAKTIEFTVQPTFRSDGYINVLLEEDFTVTIGYGEGVMP